MSETKSGVQSNRQPIVAVLGHVDHGKTSVLDFVRSLGSKKQSSVMAREAGGITQHIGATEVPADLLNNFCNEIMGGKDFRSPGLLFIDTPGHHSFTSLRGRGGALADIAILVVDIMEGCQPQTIESVKILKQHKTPFVIAANKIDRIHGWKSERGSSVTESMSKQSAEVKSRLEKHYWKLVGQFSELGYNLELYNKNTDFKNNLSVVPCSAKEGEGLQDLLAVTIGLAERFLIEQLEDFDGPAEGTVLEMKEERGLGKTIDVILYRGQLKKGDKIILASSDGAFETHIRGMFRPRGMSEMRDAGDRWDNTEIVDAAAGIKISGPDLEKVLAGTRLHGFSNHEEKEIAIVRATEEAEISVELDEVGIVIKSDTLGGLEALGNELMSMGIPIREASIGVVNKRDLRSAETSHDPLQKVILAFSTNVMPEVKEIMDSEDCDIKLISKDIIYHILEEFEEWIEEEKIRLEVSSREEIVFPGKILILRDHVFRKKDPAIVGVRVVGGKIQVGQYLMKHDGTRVGQIKSLRSGVSSMKNASQGDEVAVAINGVTVGRQIDEEDVLLVDVPSSHASKLQKMDLTSIEKEILDEIISVHRKKEHFWGR